jgi:hypothetical protein
VSCGSQSVLLSFCHASSKVEYRERGFIILNDCPSNANIQSYPYPIPTHSCGALLGAPTPSDVRCTHLNVPNVTKRCALKWFCHVVPDHILSRTPSDCQVSFCHAVSDEEIADCNTFCALTAGGLTVSLQKNFCCLVIEYCRLRNILVPPKNISSKESQA